VPELTWILFLRILDERETRERDEAEAVSAEFTPSLTAPYRWQDWAAPDGVRRKALQACTLGGFVAFVNGDLLPHLKALRERPGATPRQKVISEMMSGVERTRIDTERNLLDVLDKVNELSGERVDPTHVFALSQVYEGLLLKMGEKGNDGGQFFTPREVIRAMVRVIDPRIGETVYDPGCGTGGFLAQARPTERVWYYDLSGVKVGKKNPLTLAHFEYFFRLLPAAPTASGAGRWSARRSTRRATI
jgi:type I restriction enzyme M protein